MAPDRRGAVSHYQPGLRGLHDAEGRRESPGVTGRYGGPLGYRALSLLPTRRLLKSGADFGSTHSLALPSGHWSTLGDWEPAGVHTHEDSTIPLSTPSLTTFCEKRVMSEMSIEKDSACLDVD